MWKSTRWAIEFALEDQHQPLAALRDSYPDLQFEVVVQDLDEAIFRDDDEAKKAGDEAESSSSRGMDWISYHRLDEIYDYLDMLEGDEKTIAART